MKVPKAAKHSGALVLGAIPFVPFLEIASFLFKSTSNQVFVMNTSKIIVFIILTLFAVGALQLMYSWSSVKAFASTIPGHMTAIGILGTFIGIFFGLYNFDVSDLNKSVPLLLEGMKLAFTTSVAGLASSTVLRITHTLIISISNEPDPWGGDDEGVSVNIPGFENFSAGMFAGLLTINKRVEGMGKTLNDIQQTLEDQNRQLKK